MVYTSADAPDPSSARWRPLLRAASAMARFEASACARHRLRCADHAHGGEFAGFIDQLVRLIDQVGLADVGIGTDMGANCRPVFRDYRRFPLIAATPLARGFDSAEVAAIVGGNFIRVFRALRA